MSVMYEDLARLVMGVNELAGPPDDTIPKYAYHFVKRLHLTVKHDKENLRKNFGISTYVDTYDLPYNYILEKLYAISGRDILKSDLDRLLAQAKWKIRRDLFTFALSSINDNARSLGDYDIDV